MTNNEIEKKQTEIISPIIQRNEILDILAENIVFLNTKLHKGKIKDQKMKK